MLHRTEGIVLKTTPFGEADLIVTFLTRDCGILKTFAKSPRKIKSRFGSSLEPLTNSRISFWGKEEATLPRLTQSDIIHPFHYIRSTLKRFLNVSEIIELTLNFVPERCASKKVYSLLMNTLHALECDYETGLLITHYKIKLLDNVGFLPKLDSCGRCEKEGDAFYISHGTVLCEKCSTGFETSFRITTGVVNLFSKLLEWSPSIITRLKPTDVLLSELSALIDEHVKYITEKDIRTKAFIIS
jgi:DNA repair protein RecO (recombination protein O)